MTGENQTNMVVVQAMLENEDAAVHMATTLVREKLVAVANVNTGIRTIYELDGIIQLENEIALSMQTTADKADALVARVGELHNYEVPSVVVLPVVAANVNFAEWVGKQVD
jgi:periplasmic divalent cation tolerance protein